MNENAKANVIFLSNTVQDLAHTAFTNIRNSYERFFMQSQMIAEFQSHKNALEILNLQNQNLQNELSKMHEISSELDPKNSSFDVARVLSFVRTYSFNRIWLKNSKNYKDGRILGMVRENTALGVAIAKNGALMGILNGDENASYSAFIGDEKVPALVRFYPENEAFLLADFVPQYFSIKIGDIAVTSGLDGIFVENIRIGEVIKIIDKNGYVSAVIRPFASKKLPGYVFLVNTPNAVPAGVHAVDFPSEFTPDPKK